MLDSGNPEALLGNVLAAVDDETAFHAELDKIRVPIYTADQNGRITYWNRSCVDFAGREPQLGEDKWCVTWRLFTLDGDPIPHDECPMAVAIKERRSIRMDVAVAMRPNGSRVAFRPYPTPIFDSTGRFKGAINILIDISEEQVEALMAQAARCRRLANSTDDVSAREILRSMAAGYDESADALCKA